jgi:hypothetical protein
MSTSSSPSKANAPVAPKPVKIDLDFCHAIRELTNGKKIASKAWPAGEYCHLNNGRVQIFRVKEGDTEARAYDWVITDGDLLAMDWYTL